MNYLDIRNFYDIKNCCFVNPEKVSKWDLELLLRDEIEEIVGLINEALRKNKDEYINEIKNVRIVLEPTKTIKSKYSVSLEEVKKSAKQNPTSKTGDFLDALDRIVSSNEKAPNWLVEEYKNHISSDTASLTRVWMLGDEVAGTFTESGKGTITLYLKTICKSLDYNDFLFEVFAHEVFHAYHWFASNKKFKCTWKYKNFQKDTVKEGLASYIEYKYIRNYNVTLANNLKKTLQLIKMKHYPYSSFQYIDNDDFFGFVFNKSTEDLGEAYNLLVYKDGFVDLE